MIILFLNNVRSLRSPPSIIQISMKIIFDLTRPKHIVISAINSGRRINCKIGIATLVALLHLSGCISNSYLGISLRPQKFDNGISEIARRARAGDKQAQLELGIRYEEGRDVQRNIGRAIRLYRLAASTRPNRIWVYSLGTGRMRGSLTSIPTSLPGPGLEEAKQRLNRLDEKGPR